MLGQDSQARARVWLCTELPSPFQKRLGLKEQEAKVHSLRVTGLLGPGAEPGNGAPAPFLAAQPSSSSPGSPQPSKDEAMVWGLGLACRHAGRVKGSLGFRAAPCTAQSGGWLLQTSLKLPLKLRCHISASLCVIGPQSGSSAQEMVQSLLGSSPGLSPSAALMVCSFPTCGAAEPEGCRNQAWELYLRGCHFAWHLPLQLTETLPQQRVLP